MSNITVLGSGAWGTALAHSMASAGHNVTIWGRDSHTLDAIKTKNENSDYLPAITLHNSINVEPNLQTAIATSDILLFVIPAQATPDFIKQVDASLLRDKTIILCSKGIHIETGKILSEFFDPQQKLAVLTGPTFAREIAMGLPAAATLACKNEQLGRALARDLSNKNLRLYWNDDVIGAEILGALKNVLAIACGIVDGLGLGDNARAAIITRGMAEIARFVKHKGGQTETLLSLSGLGDIVLTCASHQSRNYSLGVSLGQGTTMDHIRTNSNTVTEGAHTALAVAKQIQNYKLDMPISLGVAGVISGKITVVQAVDAILARPLGNEEES